MNTAESHLDELPAVLATDEHVRRLVHLFGYDPARTRTTAVVFSSPFRKPEGRGWRSPIYSKTFAAKSAAYARRRRREGALFRHIAAELGVSRSYVTEKLLRRR